MNRYAKVCHEGQWKGRKLVGAVGFEPTTPTPPEFSPTAKLLNYNEGTVRLGTFRSNNVANNFEKPVRWHRLEVGNAATV